MLPCVVGFSGTIILIFLSDGVVASVTLSKSGMKGTGSIQVTFTWGLAVTLPAFISGVVSGTCFNLALTVALAVDGGLAWMFVPGYVMARFAGAPADAVLVYLLPKDQFDATESVATKLGVLPTEPPVFDMRRNILGETIGTFAPVFVIKGTGQVTGIPAGADKLLVFDIIMLAGMSLGGLIGHAIDPARDLGPRIAHTVPPIRGKGGSNWGHTSTVIIGPVADVVVAVLLYQAILWA